MFCPRISSVCLQTLPNPLKTTGTNAYTQAPDIGYFLPLDSWPPTYTSQYAFCWLHKMGLTSEYLAGGNSPPTQIVLVVLGGLYLP